MNRATAISQTGNPAITTRALWALCMTLSSLGCDASDSIVQGDVAVSERFYIVERNQPCGQLLDVQSDGEPEERCSYSYDLAGRLLRLECDIGLDQSIEYGYWVQYDDANNTKHWFDDFDGDGEADLSGSERYHFDENGRLAEIEYDNYIATVGYDDRGRRVSDVLSGDRTGFRDYFYDPRTGSLARLVLEYTEPQPSVTFAEFVYDDNGILSETTRTFRDPGEMDFGIRFSYQIDESNRHTGYAIASNDDGYSSSSDRVRYLFSCDE